MHTCHQCHWPAERGDRCDVLAWRHARHLQVRQVGTFLHRGCTRFATTTSYYPFDDSDPVPFSTWIDVDWQTTPTLKDISIELGHLAGGTLREIHLTFLWGSFRVTPCHTKST